MNRTNALVNKFGIVLYAVTMGYGAHGQPALSVGVVVPVPAVTVEIRTESDFYEPLTPQGEWVVVGSYGRCWRPAHVESDWRPYCNGNWERTDAGWYWVSDEPWAWATYHYGRWDYSDRDGWFWMPQTQWAPAWVSWHEGGGYVGWAPLQPSVRISGSGLAGFNESHISPRAFVFIKQDRFLEPVRPTSVIANNTAIIKRTTTLTNIKIVNNTVINGGPATAAIEKASGRTVREVPVKELRHKQEASIAPRGAAPGVSAVPTEKKAQIPARAPDQQREINTTPAPRSAVADKSIEAPAAGLHESKSENTRSVLPTAETKSELKSEPRVESNRARQEKQPTESKAEAHAEKPEKSGKP